jgi:hypothetical protein
MCAASAFSTPIKSSSLQDDSVWINQGIVSAIANGENSYSVPAGTYILQNPIQIPAGTSNFTLEGAGSANTILTTPDTVLLDCIMVGDLVQLHNNWNLTNRTNYPVDAVGANSKIIYVKTGTSITTNNYYVLYDTHTEWANNSNQTEVMNHAEVCKVTGYNSNTGAVTLDEPTARSYDSTAEFAAINARICTNITVKGFGMNGLVGSSGSASSSLLLCGIADHVNVSDLNVGEFFTGAIDFVNARNINVSNCNVHDSTATDPGDGYGVTIQRCRYVTVSNCVATNMRHGFIGHAGATDLTFTGCTETSCDFDLHGMDERRVSFNNCTTDGTIQIGNQAWPEGDSTVTISGGSYGSGINACAYADNVTSSKVTYLCMTVFSELTGQNSPPASQYPDNFTFNGCSFKGPHNLIAESTRFGTATFNNCTFEATNTAWGNILVWNEMSVKSFTFSACSFQLDSTRGDIPFVFNTPASLFSLTIKSSAVTSEGGGEYAVQLESGFVGNATFQTNSFKSVGGNSSATFLLNQSKGHIVNSNNSASYSAKKA